MKFVDYTFFCILLSLILIFFFFFLSHWLVFSYEDKSSSFECGFESITPSSIPFSMSFFVISLVFLLFDVEILLVCFYPLFYSFSFYSFYFIWFTVVFIILATFYEWYKGILSWL